MDNDRILAWDVKWTANTQSLQHQRDFITNTGDVEFDTKGTTHRLTKSIDDAPRTIEIEIKDFSVTPFLRNTIVQGEKERAIVIDLK